MKLCQYPREEPREQGEISDVLITHGKALPSLFVPNVWSLNCRIMSARIADLTGVGR
jgi:hypothetical protein